MSGPPANHLDEQAVDARVPRDLGVERRRQQGALPYGHDPTVVSGEHLHALTHLLHPRRGAERFMRLRDIFQNAVQICRPQADEKRIEIELVGDEELTAMVDPVLLEQAVVNLIDNAVKYSAEGSAVVVTLEERGDEVVVSVSDEGQGIAGEHLPRLFERFYRVDKARSRDLGGTGLGLAIVKHVAQIHGGRVGVHDGDSCGAYKPSDIGSRQCPEPEHATVARQQGEQALVNGRVVDVEHQQVEGTVSVSLEIIATRL